MIREFLEKAVPVCFDCEVTAKRVVRSMLLDFDYEIENKESEFSMQDQDFKDPKGRLEHGFLFINHSKSDTAKATRVKEQTELYSLKGYRAKYKTADYDEDIVNLERTIASKPIPEIDSLMVVNEVSAKGTW